MSGGDNSYVAVVDKVRTAYVTAIWRANKWVTGGNGASTRARGNEARCGKITAKTETRELISPITSRGGCVSMSEDGLAGISDDTGNHE